MLMRGLPLISLLSNYLRTIKSTTHVRVAHLFGQNLKKVFSSVEGVSDL